MTNTDVSEDTDSDAGTTGLFRAEWSVLGTLGRTALVALVLSALVAVALAVAIPLQVERFLIESEAESLASVVNDLSNDNLIPSAELSATELNDLDDAVHRHLLGREAVRVKLWAPDGTFVYSDAHELIGQGF